MLVRGGLLRQNRLWVCANGKGTFFSKIYLRVTENQSTLNLGQIWGKINQHLEKNLCKAGFTHINFVGRHKIFKISKQSPSKNRAKICKQFTDF